MGAAALGVAVLAVVVPRADLADPATLAGLVLLVVAVVGMLTASAVRRAAMLAVPAAAALVAVGVGASPTATLGRAGSADRLPAAGAPTGRGGPDPGATAGRGGSGRRRPRRPGADAGPRPVPRPSVSSVRPRTARPLARTRPGRGPAPPGARNRRAGRPPGVGRPPVAGRRATMAWCFAWRRTPRTWGATSP